jgi:hypothetical protein
MADGARRAIHEWLVMRKPWSKKRRSGVLLRKRMKLIPTMDM